MNRPNILLLVNDHQLYYRHGWDSSPQIQRPYVDQLAAEGATFSRAYTACPLCGPARRTILTGLYPHNHGHLQNDSNAPYDHELYPQTLADVGYQNYAFGKWHAGVGTALEHGSQGYSLRGYGNPYLTEPYKNYLAARNLPHPTIRIERDLSHGDRLQPEDTYVQADTGGCWEHMAGIMEAPDDAHEAFFLANLACDQLETIAAQKGAQPFCMRVDFWGPHQPYFPTQRFADLYDPAEIPIYPNFYDDLENKPASYQTELNYPMGDPNGKIVIPNPLPWSEWQKILALCYAQITLVDAAGGRVLNKLDELGLADNTLVIWTADHGDALACHGGHFNKRCYLPEEVMRVPLAIRWPNEITAGQTLGHLASNIDLAPTILDAAGTAFADPVDGESLIPIMQNGSNSWREDLLCETNGHYDPIIGRMVVTERYKYVETKDDLSELYDLDTDPYELTNLIDESQHAALHAEMRQRLAKWKLKTNDFTDTNL